MTSFAKAGGNFVDIANIYTNGTSESFLGEFLKDIARRDPRNEIYKRRSGHNPNAAGNQRKNMVQAVEASLKRLS